MGKKPLRVGVQQDHERQPPLHWAVWYLAIARAEAQAILDDAQYHHVADQFKQLAEDADPTHSKIVDVRSVEDFFELRDKGGPLGNLNIRVFFFLDRRHRAIVVLGTIKKEADGKTPLGDKVLMKVRMRRYLAGDFGKAAAKRDKPRSTRTKTQRSE